MAVRALTLALAALLFVGCASPNPSPTISPSSPIRSSGPTQRLTPTPTRPPTSTQPPITSPTPGSTDTPAASPAALSLSVEPFASGFNELTFVTNAREGAENMYAVEQAGRIRIVTPGTTQSEQPFLDITDRISSGGERGLLGLAFHPDFASNGRFFVDYTDLAGNSVISEFDRAADGTVDASAERLVLDWPQPYPNHNGGMLAFGPDGYLYIGFGDGGSGGDPQGNGQSLTTYLGKILRIDVDAEAPARYGIPPDNPFAGIEGQPLPEIWDWGVRNPWRFSFDRESGGLFIGDVGQNAWEEIDVEPAGLSSRNYGWNIMEGDHCYASATCNETGLTLPVVTYPHSDGCSVTGGYVYRGTQFPALQGRYVFSDYCSGTLWSFNADDALAGRPVERVQLGKVPFSPSSFGEDESGELYVVDLAGAIYRLVASAD